MFDLIPILAGVVAAALGVAGSAIAEYARRYEESGGKHAGLARVAQRLGRKPAPESPDDLSSLAKRLVEAVETIDSVGSELDRMVGERAAVANQLQVRVQELELQASERQARLDALKTVSPLALTEFANLLAQRERSGRRDQIIFFLGGVVATTIVELAFRAFHIV